MGIMHYLGSKTRRGTQPISRLLLITALNLALPALAGAQSPGDVRSMQELWRRLDAIEGSYARLAVALGQTASDARATEADLMAVVDRGLRSPAEGPDAENGIAWPDARVREIFAKADGLRKRILAIYAEGGLDAAREVEAAVDVYMADRSAVASAPKSMEELNARLAPRIDERYPAVARTLWAAGWLQLAAIEPLLVFRNETDRATGVTAVLRRYEQMLEKPDEAPTHMPMAPAIAPELVTRHPRAAAIFDNLSLLRGRYLDLLAEGGETRSAAGTLVAEFTDPDHMTIDEIEWIVMSLRHGIHAQGGPAIGRLERSERNDAGHPGVHGGGGRLPMPGM